MDASYMCDKPTVQTVLIHKPIPSHLWVREGWVVVCASRTQMKEVKNEAKAEVADAAALTMEHNN